MNWSWASPKPRTFSNKNPLFTINFPVFDFMFKDVSIVWSIMDWGNWALVLEFLGFFFDRRLLSIFDFLAVGFVEISFYYFLHAVGFLKNLFVCFHNCCYFKLNFGQTFEILTFNFGAKFAKFLKKPMFFNLPISPEPRIGKFQNWMEMKANYYTN